MAFTPKAGWNGLIYVSATELLGANEWGVELGHDSADVSRFGNSAKRRLAAQRDHTGSMTAWHDQAAKILQDAANADVLVAWSIYPDRSDTTTYYSGSAVFSMASEGNMSDGVSQSADFENDNAISVTGFA